MSDATTQYTQPFRIQIDVKVPMRDGVLLSADIYRPNEGSPFPTLLVRTIYDNQGENLVDWASRFVKRGYAVVMQDCRGRFDSGGEFSPYFQEAEDGYDTQEWIGAQEWCDGNIGTFGTSYVGFTQSATAPLASKYLKALVPTVSQQDNYGHWRIDGALQLHVALNFINMAGRTMQRGARNLMNSEEFYRRLPLISAIDDIADIPFYRQVIEHDAFDEFWKAYSMRYGYATIEAPAYIVTGWYDNLVHEGFKLYKGWSTEARSADARRLSKLLVGPWLHGPIGTPAPGPVDYGPDAVMDFAEDQLRWNDRRLKGIDNGMDDEPPVHIFVMGENVWRFENEWPLARTRYTSYYLHSGGGANTMFGDGTLSESAPAGDEPVDTYSYDPENPVWTLGGQIMAIQMTVAGPQDRRPMERRQDVLVYTTEPLERDVEVTGPISLVLHASTSARDTDFTGTLVDVHPDGKAINICEGLLRTRYRDSIEEPSLITPGEVYELTVEIWETSNMFKAGHRIRLEVSSSNFPRFDRNPNTGNRPGMDAEMQVADQTIYHDGQRPSHLVLPIIPR